MAKNFNAIDTFESLAELDTYEKVGLKVVHYKDLHRYGFFSPNGKKFSAPVDMFGHPTLQSLLDDVLSDSSILEFGVDTSEPCPRIVISNSALLKSFQVCGYHLVSTFVKFFVEKVSPEQMLLLSQYVIRDVLNTSDSRIELKLNRNTAYYQRKASRLSALNDGGEWEFYGLNYIEDGGECTLGHKLNWQFLVREKVTGEQIAFGSTCVQDFFNIDDQLESQLGLFKTKVLNAMLEYAFDYSVSQRYHFNLVRWQYVFLSNCYELGIIGKDKKREQLLHTLKVFSDARMLLPKEFEKDLLMEFAEPKVMRQVREFFFSAGVVGSELSLMGIIGNACIDVSSPHQLVGLKTIKHVSGALNLFGTLSKVDDLVKKVGAWGNVLSKSGMGLSKADTMHKCLILLTNTDTLNGLSILFDNIYKINDYNLKSGFKVWVSLTTGEVKVRVLLETLNKKSREHGYLIGSVFEKRVNLEKVDKTLKGYPFIVYATSSQPLMQVNAYLTDLLDKVTLEVLDSKDEKVRDEESLGHFDVKKAVVSIISSFPKKFMGITPDKVVTSEGTSEMSQLQSFTNLQKACSKVKDKYDYRATKGINSFSDKKSWESHLKNMASLDKLFVSSSKDYVELNDYQVSQRTLALWMIIFIGLYKAGFKEFGYAILTTNKLNKERVADEVFKNIFFESTDRAFDLFRHGYSFNSNVVYQTIINHEGLD